MTARLAAETVSCRELVLIPLHANYLAVCGLSRQNAIVLNQLKMAGNSSHTAYVC
jgi:hypothetical protein